MTPIVHTQYHPSLIPAHVVTVTKVTKHRVTFVPVGDGTTRYLPGSMRRDAFEREYISLEQAQISDMRSRLTPRERGGRIYNGGEGI